MPKALLLDVMGTLVTEPFFTHIPAFFGMSLEALIRQKHPTSWVEFEKGLITEEAYFASFFSDGRAIDGPALRATLREAYDFLPGIEALLTELSGRLPMYALSNYPVWYELIEEKLRLSRFLDWRFVSAKTGVRKPDAEAFEGPVRALGINPVDFVFVDDRASNCAAARRVGMEAVCFEGADSLRASLLSFGIL